MTRAALRFWGSAVLAAAAFAALVPLLFPFRALGMDPAADRPRIWLLTVFCAGVMALLFGVTGLIGGRFLGLREVLEHRSATLAIEAERRAREKLADRGWRNAGGWTMAAGASLIAIYFVLLAVLG
ncbi:MAG TPA: hypothetical protein VJT67_06170 [Longimicrobiaceae bacterium]|nr:hypothetical protein [Longimicrobiaceae bacterium]